MTRITRRLMLAAGASAAIAPYAPVLAQSRRMIIGTQPAGTGFYLLAGGLAKLFSEKMNVPTIVQPYSGASVYIPLIDSGEATMGLASTLETGIVYRGDQGRQRLAKLRTVARVYPLPYTFIVRADSGIKTVAELKGKRVVMDFSAILELGQMNRALLLAGGVKDTEVEALTVGGLGQGMAAMTDKTAAATVIAAGNPVVKEAHATIPGGIRYLNMTGPDANDEFMAKTLPGTATMMLNPSPTLPEVTEPIRIGTFDILLIASADTPDATVKTIVETMIDNWPGMQSDYPVLRGGNQAEFARATNTAPFHPGAIAAYKGRNMWTAKNDENEARLPKG